MTFNPAQPRDRVGRWTSGGVALARTTERAASIRPRVDGTARGRWTERARRIESADIAHYRAQRGYRITDAERRRVEYMGPTAWARDAAGQSRLMPRQAVLASARGGRARSSRAVAVNPATRKYVTVRSTREVATADGRVRPARRPVTLSSAAAKRRSAPEPAYVGRRRASAFAPQMSVARTGASR